MDRSFDGARDVSSETCALDDTARDNASIEQVESAPSTTVLVVDSPDTDEGPRQDTEAISESSSAVLDPGTEADAVCPTGGGGENAMALQNLGADRADSSSNCPSSKDGRSNETLNIDETRSSPQPESTTRSVSPRTVPVRSSPSRQQQLRYPVFRFRGDRCGT